MKKRFLSVLLALCLSLSLVPAMAFAEGTFTNDGILSNDDAVYDDKVKNSIPGIISGGTFNNTVENNGSGTISGGTFYGKVENKDIATIEGGVFYGGISGSYSFPPKTTCYSVEFNLNGGVGDIPTQYFVDTTSGVALEPQTNPTRDGYDFPAGTQMRLVPKNTILKAR